MKDQCCACCEGAGVPEAAEIEILPDVTLEK